jgi:hypothetical protein
LDLIAGLPFEDYETFRKSFDEIYALQPNQLQMGFLKVLKGSYMYENAEEYGILYHDTPPYEVLSTKWLSYEDVICMKRIEEMLEVYYNSGQYEITMEVLGKYFASAFDMYRSLGDFYEAKGYFGMSHSRIRRCEILLEFLEEIWKQEEQKESRILCIREALVFDLYYRENCKSRPGWAGDMAAFKHITHFYCKNGKMSHVEPFHYDFLTLGARAPVYEEKLHWVMFSYDRRDPLNGQAHVQEIYPEDEMDG